MTLHKPFYICALCACLLLMGCGNSRGDRASTGALIGGTIGAVAAGGNPAVGAAAGAVVGGAIGAITDEDDIDFSEW